jgi:hypothetical protein
MNSKRLLFALMLLAPAAVFAAKSEGPKARTMAKYDLDHDGKLSAAEITAIQHDFAKAPTGDLGRFDADKDGKLSAEEIAKIIPGSGKKSETDKKSGHHKPKSADTKPAGS